MTASFNVPDNISFDELKNLAEAAAEREEAEAKKEPDPYKRGRVDGLFRLHLLPVVRSAQRPWWHR